MSRTIYTLLILSACAGSTIRAATVNVLSNGTFESGNTAGWTSISNAFADTGGSCNDAFSASTTGAGCIAGLAPVDGIYDADMSVLFPSISNDTGEWADYLNQTFVAPVGATSAQVKFDSTATCTGAGTFRGCDVLVQLYSGSTFLGNFYTLTNPNGNVALPWTSYTWDVTSILQTYAGQTLTFELVSLAFFDTRSSSNTSATGLNAAFDNVQLNVTTPTSATPEPATTSLIAGALLLAAGSVSRRRVTSTVVGLWRERRRPNRQTEDC